MLHGFLHSSASSRAFREAATTTKSTALASCSTGRKVQASSGVLGGIIRLISREGRLRIGSASGAGRNERGREADLRCSLRRCLLSGPSRHWPFLTERLVSAVRDTNRRSQLEIDCANMPRRSAKAAVRADCRKMATWMTESRDISAV